MNKTFISDSDIINLIKLQVSEPPKTIEDVITILPKLILYIERFKNIRGPEKAKLIKNALMECSAITPSFDNQLKDEIHIMIPLIIDAICLVANSGVITKMKKSKWCMKRKN